MTTDKRPSNEETLASAGSRASSVATKAVKQETSNGVLQYTPIKDIPIGVQRVVSSFHNSGKTHSLQYRLNQIRNVYFILKDNVDNICDALEKDFLRSPGETRMFEVVPCLNELLHTMASVHKWARPEKVTDLPRNLINNKVYIERIPVGAVLIIAPFNYPLLLSVAPIVGAIAAGNTVVYKPTEQTPHFSKLLTELLTEALDSDIFFAVNGAIPETTALLEEKFDKILYTGNNFVGTIIAKKAAETLTPCILELGGKSPAFVIKDVKEKDIKTIARRIAWGRFVNAGQTCVAVDYVLVHRSHKEQLVKEIVNVLKEEFYSDLDKSSKHYTHVIHDRAFQNLSKIVKSTKGDVVYGGESDAATRFFHPTVIDNVSWDDSAMRGEIFGPILPIITYDTLDDVLKPLQQRHDTPLAQYIFTSGSADRSKNHDLDRILTSVRSGGVMVNDVILHVGLANAPFGGIGQSGYGAYHGYFSFRSFSHERTTIEQHLWNEFSLTSRYPPLSQSNEDLMTAAMSRYNGKVWFGRKGDVNVGGPGAFFNFWSEVSGFASLIYLFAKGG